MGEKVSITVSIVEDNQFIKMALEQIILATDGYELKGSYSSAEEAIEKIPLAQPDIVLMDINLGGMSGIEAVAILKEQCPDILFMMCTVYEDDEKIFDALTAGASGYILKKSKPSELMAAVRELSDGGAPMSSQIASKVVSSFRKKEVSKENLHETLTSREYEILESLVKGRLYKEIGQDMNISTETVRKHVYNVYRKLHINNRVEAYNKFFGKGEIERD
ncbi:MAG: response regulator [Chitinophagia bacterium]|jgi:DNA-binding NarL/FixJ family response regulator